MAFPKLTLVFLFVGVCSVFGATSDLLLATRKSAEAGNAQAQYRYARHFAEAGKMTEAEKWYKASASQGYSESLYELGRFYLSDRMSKANPAKGLSLLELAAAQGHGMSHHFLGIYLHDRTGAQRDKVKAFKHLSLSGSKLVADVYLKKLILEMSEQEINQAKKQAREFTPTTFEKAFQSLLFQRLNVDGIVSTKDQKIALLNGQMVEPGQSFTIEVAGLPAELKCEAIESKFVRVKFRSRSETLQVK